LLATSCSRVHCAEGKAKKVPRGSPKTKTTRKTGENVSQCRAVKKRDWREKKIN